MVKSAWVMVVLCFVFSPEMIMTMLVFTPVAVMVTKFKMILILWFIVVLTYGYHFSGLKYFLAGAV